MKSTSETGRKGEDAACLFLERNGHIVIGRNWRSSHYEIDILTLKDGALHIVEVKTRKAPCTADPEVNISRSKMHSLVKAAEHFLHRNHPELGDVEVFFDVVTVIISDSGAEIEYYPKAFVPIYV